MTFSFLALTLFGKDWKKVEEYISTRTGAQIRSHAQKFFNRVQKEYKVQNPCSYICRGEFSETQNLTNLGNFGESPSILEKLEEKGEGMFLENMKLPGKEGINCLGEIKKDYIREQKRELQEHRRSFTESNPRAQVLTSEQEASNTNTVGETQRQEVQKEEQGREGSRSQQSQQRRNSITALSTCSNNSSTYSTLLINKPFSQRTTSRNTFTPI